MSYASYKNIGIDKDAPSQESMVHVPEIENLHHRKTIISNYPVVVIDYYTTWCGPCKTASPRFSQLAKKYGEKGILFMKEDAEKKFGDYPAPLRGVPCFHFYIEGKFIPEFTVTGASVEQVEENILNILKIRV
jgi:thiol-disulfide isomerase/thioredoxin